MTLEQTITGLAKEAVKALYGVEAADSQIQLQKTRAEFEGNITLVVFPFVKLARKAPQQVAAEIGEWLLANSEGLVAKYNAVQGFLNLSISDTFWVEQLGIPISRFTSATSEITCWAIRLRRSRRRTDGRW